MKRVSRAEAEVYPLPGRDWHTYLGPQNIADRAHLFGVSVFPAGSAPEGHVHDTQEETIYCVSGPRPHHHPRRGRRAGTRRGRLGQPRHPACHRIRRPRAARDRLLLQPAGRARLLRERPRRPDDRRHRRPCHAAVAVSADEIARLRGHGPAHPRGGHPHRHRSQGRPRRWPPLRGRHPGRPVRTHPAHPTPTSPTGPSATASSCPRATRRWASTRPWPWRAISRSKRCSPSTRRARDCRAIPT